MHGFPNICGKFSNTKCVFKNLVISVGRFVTWDVLTLGTLCPWDFFPWDILSLRLYVLGRFVYAPLLPGGLCARTWWRGSRWGSPSSPSPARWRTPTQSTERGKHDPPAPTKIGVLQFFVCLYFLTVYGFFMNHIFVIFLQLKASKISYKPPTPMVYYLV